MSSSTDSNAPAAVENRVFVVPFPEWVPAPPPTPDALRTPPLAGPNSPLKGFAIPLTYIEIDMYMDNFGDDGELEMDSTDMHRLFPHVEGALLIGFDFEEEREILIEEVLVPVPAGWGIHIRKEDEQENEEEDEKEDEEDEAEGTGPRFWRATAVVLAHNRKHYDLDVGQTGDLVRALQQRLGVTAQPGWYEVVESESSGLTDKEIRKLCKKSGSSELRQLASENWISY